MAHLQFILNEDEQCLVIDRLLGQEGVWCVKCDGNLTAPIQVLPRTLNATDIYFTTKRRGFDFNLYFGVNEHPPVGIRDNRGNWHIDVIQSLCVEFTPSFFHAASKTFLIGYCSTMSKPSYAREGLDHACVRHVFSLLKKHIRSFAAKGRVVQRIVPSGELVAARGLVMSRKVASFVKEGFFCTQLLGTGIFFYIEEE